MSEKLFEKIEELIKLCPKDWARLSANKMDKSIFYVRKVRKGLIGKRNFDPQIALIGALKEVSKEYEEKLTEALR